jgi:Protein of unknown function (DUF2631)
MALRAEQPEGIVAAEPETGSRDPVRADGVHHNEVAHVTERPEQWGWHADLGKPAQIAGWATVIVLLLGTTATHYNGAGDVALLATAGILVVALIWSARAKRTAWRR